MRWKWKERTSSHQLRKLSSSYKNTTKSRQGGNRNSKNLVIRWHWFNIEWGLHLVVFNICMKTKNMAQMLILVFMSFRIEVIRLITHFGRIQSKLRPKSIGKLRLESVRRFLKEWVSIGKRYLRIFGLWIKLVPKSI